MILHLPKLVDLGSSVDHPPKDCPNCTQFRSFLPMVQVIGDQEIVNPYVWECQFCPAIITIHPSA